MEEKGRRRVASVSFGKDSLAMLILLFETRSLLDEVVFVDTGKEFQSIYRNRDIVAKECESRGVKFTTLSFEQPFDWYFDSRPFVRKNGEEARGYSWCGGVCRWGTRLKKELLDKYTKDSIVYIGFAVDEEQRILRDKNPLHRFPLRDFGRTEKDCLRICYSRGYSWNEDGVELYNVLNRVSCWCCRNKNLEELKAYYQHLPKYWEALKEMQMRTPIPFRKNESVFDLEKRFSASFSRG